MVYTLNPIPADAKPWHIRDAERLRKSFVEDAYEDDGVLRWKSNNRPVPHWSFREALATASDRHLEVERKESAESLRRYREEMANHVPDAEELYEMRAAFGTGTTVVNILTGRRARL